MVVKSFIVIAFKGVAIVVFCKLAFCAHERFAGMVFNKFVSFAIQPNTCVVECISVKSAVQSFACPVYYLFVVCAVERIARVVEKKLVSFAA